MRRQHRTRTRIVAALLTLLLLLPAGGLRVGADSAPMWPSPIGLAPGFPPDQPAPRVQMAAEAVDIQVVERDDEVRALVTATFDLHNHGPEATMQVGFPIYAASVLLQESGAGYSPITSTPDLESFVARADGLQYVVSREQVITRPGDRYGDEWYVWQMTFPTGRTVRLDVAYEQPLTWDTDVVPAWALPMYVLRTGALWDGPIGRVAVTMSAPDGGVFLGGPLLYLSPTSTLPAPGDVLGPDEADEASSARVVWDLRDIKPDRDVGATYVVRDTWRTLREGEAAGVKGDGTAATYLHATQAALRVIDASGPEYLPMGPAFAPAATVERFGPQVRRWASRAVELGPTDPAAWVAYGDVEVWFARPARTHDDGLACWPVAAVDAYRRAEALGSTSATLRLTMLNEIPAWMLEMGEPALQPCPARPAR